MKRLYEDEELTERKKHSMLIFLMDDTSISEL
jgi:hypothetical protein